MTVLQPMSSRAVMHMRIPSTRGSLLIRLRNGARAGGGADRGDAGWNEAEHAAAWAEFVRIYSPHVLRWCRGCGLQETDATDVCQDVLVRFWKQAANFEYDSSRRFRNYLRQILTTALSAWSAGRKRDGLAVSLGDEAALDGLPAREGLLERIEEAYDTELLAVAMEEVKGRVKPHTWRAFELVAVEQKSGKEASEELGISADLVYAAKRNVHKMLQETVARLEGGQRE